MTLKPDPAGHAALMLCESLMILLVEGGMLQKAQLIEAIETLTEVETALAEQPDGDGVSLLLIGLLRAAGQSVSAATAPGPGVVQRLDTSL